MMETLDSTRTTFRRILFCTDFSENADLAFDFALDAASRRPNSELHLLHVIPEAQAQFWKTYIYEVDDVDGKAKRDVDERIAAYQSRVPENLTLEVAIRIGNDHQEILAFARENKIDLIVMGRQGRGSLQKALFGNVTEKVVRKADCAVLVVPLSRSKQVSDD
jgi:nucleotide-binding universal stress UspA family protein